MPGYGVRVSDVHNDQIRLGLNDFLYNPMERMIARRASSRTLAESPAVPTATAAGMYGYNIIRWIEMRCLAIDSARKRAWQYRDTRPANLFITSAVGSTWEYQVASIKTSVLVPGRNGAALLVVYLLRMWD